MSTPIGYVAEILKDALELLSEDESDGCAPVSPEVCRVALYLGGEVPWDECGGNCSGDKSGMLWAKIVSVDPTTGQDQGGSCQSWTWTAEFGIVRCIAGPKGEKPPTAAQIQADADQQLADADAIFTVLNCCASRPESLKDVTVTRWAPVGPSGNCAGGTWLVRGRLDVCC